MAEADLLVLGGVIALALVARLAADLVRAPPVPVYVAAGLVGGTFLATEHGLVRATFDLSIVFLLFAAGVQMNPGRVRGPRVAAALAFGVGGAAVAGALAAGAALVLGWSGVAALYAAAGVAFSSTLLGLRALAARDAVATAHGRLLVGGLLAQDAVALLLIATLPAAVEGPAGVARAAAATAVLAGFAFLGLRVARWPRVWRVVREREVRTLLAFGLLFAFLLASRALGAPPAAGAFLAGVAASAYPANVHMRPAVRAARDFFTPLFFVLVGASFPLPDVADAAAVLLVLAALLVVKPLVMGVAARLSGLPRVPSAQAAVLAAHGSEFALVLAAAGVAAEQLSAEQYGVLGLAVALSMLLGPLVPRVAGRALARALPSDPPPPTVPRRGHVVVLGAGRTGGAVAAALAARGEDVVAADLDPVALSALPATVPVVVGDVRSARVLEAARVADARAVVVVLGQDEATRLVLRALRELGPEVRFIVARVASDAIARELESSGARVVRREDVVSRALDAALDRLAV